MWIRIACIAYVAIILSRLTGKTEEPPVVPHMVCLKNGTTTSWTSSNLVLHQGPCGKCSNEGDLAAYRRTALNLTSIATQCALVNLLSDKSLTKLCMNRVGLSSDCVDCWTSNMACTAKACSLVCLHHVMTSWMSGSSIAAGSTPEKLNPCLKCDEERCGPSFKLCAGANRRNSGIHSDIPRPLEEIAML
jgi:hypothetical protein